MNWFLPQKKALAPLMYGLFILAILAPSISTAQCDPPSFSSVSVTGTNSATICWTSGQNNINNHIWNVKVDNLSDGIVAVLDEEINAGTSDVTTSGNLVCYVLSLPLAGTQYEVYVAEQCNGDVPSQSDFESISTFITNAAAPDPLVMPTVYKTINQSVTHTASFTDIALDPSPLTGNPSRLQFTRDLLSDVNNLGDPNTGNAILYSIIENLLGINIPDWLETEGASLGIPGVIEFSVNPTLNFGVTADYGGYIGIGSVGTADVDVSYPVDISIRVPQDQKFGCSDKIIVETSAALGNGANLEITPAFYETDLGPILDNASFTVTIGLTASIKIGCVPEVGCAYRNNWDLLDELNIPGGELVNIPLDLGFTLPSFIQLCEEAFDNNANIGSLVDCAAGSNSIFQGIIDIVNNQPNSELLLNTMFSASNTEVTIAPPDLPSGGPDIPEFDGTFMKLTKDDLVQDTDGNKLTASIAGGKFEELSKLRLDLISLVDYFGVPTSASLGGGLGSIDFGDLNLILSTDLILDYELDPTHEATLDLGEAMDWRVFNPSNNATISSGNSQSIPNVEMGHHIEIIIPDDFDQTATINEELFMSADFTTESEIMYNNSLSIELFQFDCCAGAVEFSLIPEIEIVETKMPGSPKTIEDHTLNWGIDEFSSATQSFDLVPDQTAPTLVCQTTTVVLNAWGTASILPEDVYDAANSLDLPTDGTGEIKLLSVYPNSFSCDDLSGQMVILTAEDGNCNMSTCQVAVTVLDETRPEIDCAPNFVIENDESFCGALVAIPRPQVTDNCEFVLRARFREVDENNSPLSGWSSWMADPDGYYAVGRWRVQWRAKDASNNQRRCNIYFDVIDTEKPIISCYNQTYVFNGEESLDLILSDFTSATDNCEVATLEIDLDKIYCEQLSEIITITATAVDIYDNFNTCTSTLIIDGLPCGWSQEPDGIGCEDGNDADYDVPSETFILSSTDCHNAITTDTDEYAFVQYNLCGNGTITAEVTSLEGNSNGWAGVIMRENNEAQAKSVSMMTNLSSNHRRETRASTGGSVTSQLLPAFNRHWLRIKRTGSSFRIYASYNGFSWFLRSSQTVVMDDCIEVGLVVNGYNGNSDMVATFENVTVSGAPIFEYNAYWDDATVTEEEASSKKKSTEENSYVNPGFTVYPNPSTGIFNLDWDGTEMQAGFITVFNAQGKTVQSRTLEQNLNTIDLSTLPGGMYLLQIKLPDGTVETERLILQHRP